MTTRGVALPLTLLLLAATGLLAMAMIWVAVLEARSGRNALAIVQAHAAAETGAVRAVRSTPRAALEALPPGDSVVLADSLGAAGSYRGTVRALGSGVFAVRVQGFAPGRTGRQTVVILAVIGDSAGLEPLAARGWIGAH